jgi:teichoic acid transport system ATP-binding protein
LRHREQEEVIALDGVSFRVAKGEAYGIIGRNGAGKSTLLRCIAGTLRPNAGKVVVNGKLSTLLQLGVGFNPELSGHRNIYLGALAAGLRKKEIDQIFDDIVEYAELGSAIDRPVKTYSSGMFAKLAFSVSMHLDPDVLLLDEVLAVGDVAFRAKSMETMQELLDKSGTIVFVSHSMNSVEEFCDRVLWLQDGRVMAEGDAAEVVGLYKKAATGSTKNA